MKCLGNQKGHFTSQYTTYHLKIQDGGCWHVRFIAFTTILLNTPYRSRRFIYFKASFSCKIHQGKIYKTQRVLVANLATNFWILVASTIILVALATVLGAISCPEYYLLNNIILHAFIIVAWIEELMPRTATEALAGCDNICVLFTWTAVKKVCTKGRKMLDGAKSHYGRLIEKIPTGQYYR